MSCWEDIVCDIWKWYAKSHTLNMHMAGTILQLDDLTDEHIQTPSFAGPLVMSASYPPLF